MYIVCSNCNGRKYVLDKAALVFTVGIFPLMDWLIGGPDSQKASKEKCHTCDGRGYIEFGERNLSQTTNKKENENGKNEV